MSYSEFFFLLLFVSTGFLKFNSKKSATIQECFHWRKHLNIRTEVRCWSCFYKTHEHDFDNIIFLQTGGFFFASLFSPGFVWTQCLLCFNFFLSVPFLISVNNTFLLYLTHIPWIFVRKIWWCDDHWWWINGNPGNRRRTMC